MTRARNITNAFITPCSSVIVTMSPLAMCATSWASTPSTSSCRIERSRPRTRRRGCGSCSDPSRTRSPRASRRCRLPASAGWPGASAAQPSRTASRAWLLPVRPSTSCTPVARFAIHRDICSEMNAPPMPQTRQNTASAWRFSPSGPMPLPTPRNAATTLSVRTIAMLVSDEQENSFAHGGFRIPNRFVVGGRG